MEVIESKDTYKLSSLAPMGKAQLIKVKYN